MSASVPGFLTKTFEIFSSPEYGDCCGWGPNGDTIIIRKIEHFSKFVLPKYFKHSNFQSFVRQLNMYDFHKTVQDPSHGEFQHQYFRQNQPELLVHIKRKANRAVDSQKKLSNKPSSGSAAALSALDASTVSSSSAGSLIAMGSAPGLDDGVSPEEIALEARELMKDLEQQKAMRADFERRMEMRMSELEGENHALKSLFLEAHQKTLIMQERLEKIFKTMYVLFVRSQNGKGLNGRALNMLLPDLNGNYLNGPPRAIMDAPPDHDTFPLERLPSIDFNIDSLPGPADPATVTASASSSSFASPSAFGLFESPLPHSGASYAPYGAELLDNRYAGGELSKVTSFDFAAASVTAPTTLKSFKSFDASLFDTAAPVNGSAFTGERGAPSSDRIVELPPEESASATPSLLTTNSAADSEGSVAIAAAAAMAPLSAQTNNNAFTASAGGSLKRTASVAGVPTYTAAAATVDDSTDASPEKRLRFTDEAVEGVAQSVPFSGSATHTAVNTAPSSAVPADTAQFIDLLNRNQNTTLNRLDSLEMTLNTLWDSFEDESSAAKTV